MVILPLLLASAVAAAPAKPAPAKRPLADLIAIALADGASRPLKEPVTSALGLSGTIETKAFRFKEADSPDGVEHAFHVMTDEKGASELVLLNADRAIIEGVKHSEGWNFRASRGGKLRAAAFSKGPVGAMITSPVPPDSLEARVAFRKEIEFYEGSWTVRVSTR